MTTAIDKASPQAKTRGLELTDPVDQRTRSAGKAEEVCPSCDAPGSWRLSRRHRFNPFGGVTMLVLSFWTLFVGLLVDVGYYPALLMFLLGLALIASSRTMVICKVCGYVRRVR